MAQKINHTNMNPVDVHALVVRGKLGKFPNGYLDKDKIKTILRHLLLNVYKYTREDVITKIDHQFFQRNLLGGIRKFFEYGDNEAIIYSFPEWDIKHWEFRKVSANFWSKEENRRDYVLWICSKENLDATKKDDLRKITAQMIFKYHGSKAMKYSGGLYELLDTVEKGKYKKWEITRMTSWSIPEVIEATKWLIDEKLNYTPEQVCKIKVEDFAKNNLDGMLQKECNHSILTALELAYPGKYYRTKARGILLRT